LDEATSLPTFALILSQAYPRLLTGAGHFSRVDASGADVRRRREVFLHNFFMTELYGLNRAWSQWRDR
jgi:hypothetical protein